MQSADYCLNSYNKVKKVRVMGQYRELYKNLWDVYKKAYSNQ